ncbi:MAG: hypothetical protein WCW44_03425 [archaeon]
MNRTLMTSIVLIGIALLFFGCTGGFNAADIAKLDSSVQGFLSQHPNADIKVVQINAIDFNAMQSEVSTQCEIPMAVKDYWRVRITDSATQLKMTVWIDSNTQKVICVIKEGQDTNGVVPPADTNTVVNPPADNNSVVNPPVDNNTIVTPPADTNQTTDTNTAVDVNVTAQAAIDRVKVGNIYLSIAEIELDSYGTGIDSIKLRADNETDVEQSISKKISMSVLNDSNEVVDASTYQPSLSISGMKELQFESLTSTFLYEKLSPGTYTLKIGFYNDGSTTTNTFLTKKITIGPDADKVIIYPRKVETFTPTESITLGQVKVLLESIKLDTSGTTIDEFKLRLENQAITDESVSKEFSAEVLNDKNEVMDVSSYNPSVSVSDIKEMQFEILTSVFLYEKLSPGTYTVVAKFYNSGSAKSSVYLTKTIRIGPDELQTIENAKKIMNYTVTAGEITKVTLDSYGTAVDEFSYKVSGTTLSSKVIVAIMLNDKNEVVDLSSYAQSINAGNIVNDLLSVNNSFLYEKLPNGEYTLLVQIYNSKSSVPGIIMAKKVTISPDAPKDQ